jgi:type II secretory pathway component PulK
MNKSSTNRDMLQNRHGIVLLVTLVLLVVLATLGYTLTSRVSADRHRKQYIIDYSKARYGCDSAVKYTLATLEEIDPQLISRPNEPDFSDLFALDEIGYQELLAQWQDQPESTKNYGRNSKTDKTEDINNPDDTYSYNNLDSTVIRGPYGPPWPLATEPAEFEIGSVKVGIEIEDENAKYPLGWPLLDYPEPNPVAEAGFVTFCEMAGLDSLQIESLKGELNTIGDIKPFKLDFKPITTVTRTPITQTRNRTTVRKSSTGKATATPGVRRKVVTVTTQISEQNTHFSRLFHSSLMDTETLARPNEMTGSRKESALKYIGTWGSRQVNINTAPRHVLEAAFIFGGDEVKIADEIIQRRRIQPFADIADLKNALGIYSEQISKCEPYITMKSTLFTIRITAISGVAKASSVIAIRKEGTNVTRIAIINS